MRQSCRVGFGSEDSAKAVVAFRPVPAARADPGVVAKFFGDPVALGAMGIGVTHREAEPKANHDLEDGPEDVQPQSLRRWGGRATHPHQAAAGAGGGLGKLLAQERGRSTGKWLPCQAPGTAAAACKGSALGTRNWSSAGSRWFTWRRASSPDCWL